MAWFLVPRYEIHQSSLVVEANSANEAYKAVHQNGQGTELGLDYHHTPDEQPEPEFIEELTPVQVCIKAFESLQPPKTDDAVSYGRLAIQNLINYFKTKSKMTSK